MPARNLKGRGSAPFLPLNVCPPLAGRLGTTFELGFCGARDRDLPAGICSRGARTADVCPSRRHHKGSLDCGPSCVATVPTSPPVPWTTATPLYALLQEAAREERRQIEAREQAQAAQRLADLRRWEKMAPHLVALEQAGRRCHDESLRNRRLREVNHWGSVTDPPPSPASMKPAEGDCCMSSGGHLYYASGAAPNTAWVQKV